MPLEVEERGFARGIQWVLSNGSLSSEQVADTATVLREVDQVFSGDKHNIQSLPLQDPETFRASK